MESATDVAARNVPIMAFSGRLMFIMLVTAVMVMIQHGSLPMPYHVARTQPSFSRLIELQPAPEPAADASIFNEEMQLGSKELLDRWNPLVAEAAQRFHVPAAWIRAVMRRESGGRTKLGNGQPIVSSAGAMGVMQLMPGTYGEMAKQYRLGSDPFNPRDNVFAAAGYLRWLHGRYGYPAMFAAYNDGPGNYEDHLRGRRLPAETRNYVKAIASELGLAGMFQGAQLQFTRPDGGKVTIDAGQVSAVRAVIPGEYAPSVHAVVTLGRTRQGVREEVATVVQRLRQHGVRV